ncbi:MAG: tRNA (adenosine(37)-N6)-dimethylallyltransferase MiaA [Deltaproteobacteria bacterium]
METGKEKVVVIAGPTASGKSGLAVELSLLLQGEIVNADSMQVYRYMDIGTAKPSAWERGAVPHHLLDVVDPDQEFNAALYRSLAVPIIREVLARGKVCFVVGGTGLYIKTLLGGILRCPPVDPALRQKLRDQAEAQGFAALHKRLEELDPESAKRIHPHDRVRVLRSLELIELANKPLSAMLREHRFQDSAFQALKICLQIDREELYHRIDERSVLMAEKGLIEETEDLLARGYSPDLKPMKSLGYRHAVRYLEGHYDREEMVRQLQLDTRRYAKRQLTWFRADPSIRWIDSQRKEHFVDTIASFVRDP